MRPPHHSHRVIPMLLAAAVLAACDQRTPDLPTGARAEAGQAGIAPLVLAGADSVPGRYVVVMKESQAFTAAAEVARHVVAAHGGRVHHTYGAALNGFAATLSPAAVEALRRNPRVQYVAQDAMTYPDQTTQPGATWGLDRVDQRNLPLSTTYVYSRTGAGVRVYVIDSGIRTSHNEFGGRASVGTDLVGDGQNGQDCNGHGTHVAGTIAGATYGVAKAAQVISVRVFPCSGGTATSTVIAAVDWVTANAVKPAVTNMSLGGGYYAPLNSAVANSIASGVVYTLSAGNSTDNACNYSPASTPAAITVGATASNDARSTFSNWGTCVDVFAPGSAITSAWWSSNTAINTINGTSMAAPHVAGVAALYLQGSPAATPATVAAQIQATATANRLSDLGTGSPNRLLFSGLTVEPPGASLGLTPAALTFDFVRTVNGAAVQADPAAEAAAPQAFTATGPGRPRVAPEGAGAGDQATATSLVLSNRAILSNTGTAGLNWTATSNRPWLTADPTDGALNAGFTTLINATVNAAGLAEGTHAGAVAVNGPGATNGPVNLNVTVNVLDAAALLVGVPRTGQAGALGSRRYYAVTVPTGATSLTVAITGGTGDADLYVRYGNVPTSAQFDCRPYLGGNVESCTVSYPLPGTYYVMLYGWNSYSGVTLSASGGGPPAAPANLAARPVSATAIQLTWTDASVNETAFYAQRRSQSPAGAWSAWADAGGSGPNAVSFTSTGLTGGVPYQFRLRTCNAAGCSAWVESVVVTIPTAAPAAPFNVAATPFSATGIGVTWTDGSSDETDFRVGVALRNLDGTWPAYTLVAVRGPNVTSFNNSGLLAGRQYRYQVAACNPVGCSAWAASNVVALPTIPGVPTAISGTPIAPGTIRVAWTDGSGAETSFELARATVTAGVPGAFGHLATVPPAAGVYTQVLFNNAGLPPGTYRYRVRSCTLAGCSAWVTSGDVVVPPVPGAPTGLTGLALSTTSIRINWTDAGAVETSYQVYRALRNLDGTWPAYTSVATLGANAVTFTNTSLLSGRAYRYQVRACNVSGCSAWATSPILSTP